VSVLALLAGAGEDWRDRAACRAGQPDWMFPSEQDKAGIEFARRVCRPCPVRRECLRWALDNAEQHGIWGGATPDERALAGVRRWCTRCRRRFEPKTRNHRRCDGCRDGRSK
jgi:WhiB family redox-sensing transcriptional regulator